MIGIFLPAGVPHPYGGERMLMLMKDRQRIETCRVRILLRSKTRAGLKNIEADSGL